MAPFLLFGVNHISFLPDVSQQFQEDKLLLGSLLPLRGWGHKKTMDK